MSDIDPGKLRAVQRLCRLKLPPDKPQCPDGRCVCGCWMAGCVRLNVV